MQQSDPLLETIRVVQDLIRLIGGRGVYIGAVALGLSVQPRATKDVDALVLVALDDPAEVWRVARGLGFELFDGSTIESARANRFLSLVFAPTNVRVDLQIGILEYDYAVVERGIPRNIGGLEVRSATPEDIVVMKAVAGRPQDLADIDSVFRIVENLDFGYIKDRLEEFREFVETPENIDRIISRYLN